MRTAIWRAWSRLRAGLGRVENFAYQSLRTDNLADDSLPDVLKRDLGLKDGRAGFCGDARFRWQKALEATRLPQGPL